jgi:O-antigen/teichoic acid export membrane protein
VKIKNRILQSIGAQSFGFLISIGIQILIIPIVLKYWGIEYYGEWLIISSVPSYIAMSDLGFGTATSTEIALLLANNQQEKANTLFNSSFYFILFIGILVLLILSILPFIFPLYETLSLKLIPEDTFKIAYLLLSLYIFLLLVLTLPQGLYRSNGLYARGQYISNIFRVFEFISFIIVIIGGYKIILAATCYLIVRVLYTIFIFYDIHNHSKWLSVKRPNLDKTIIIPLLEPSLSFVAITIGQAILNQGIITVIGMRSNSANVVIYSTLRTLANFSKQLIGFINNAFWGELSKTYAAQSLSIFKSLLIKLNQINISVTILCSIFLYFFGEHIISIWTGSTLNFDTLFFYLFLIYILVENIWSSNWTMLMSINKQKETVKPFLFCSILTVLLTYFMLPKFNLVIVPGILTLSSLIMMINIFNSTSKIVNLKVNKFLQLIFSLNEK